MDSRGLKFVFSLTAANSTTFKILSWNINGTKNKFQQEDVKSMLNNYDVIVISETHFNERTRCPEGFAYKGRSQKVPSKIPRGGVAI